MRAGLATRMSARRLGDADELIAGSDVAQPAAAVDDIVPSECLTRALGGEAVQHKIADQPRRIITAPGK